MSTTEKIQVSVIIPIYNDKEAVEGLIKDFRKQSYDKSKYEVVFIDDHSTDQTFKLLNEYKKKEDFNINVLRTDINSGAYVARNLGIKKSEGDLLLFLDSDCRIDEDWISNFVSDMNKEIDAGVGYTENVSEGLLNELNQEVNERHFEDVQEGKQEPMVNTRCLGLWRETIEKYGAFREDIRRGGDTEYGMRLLSNNCEIRYFRDVNVKHLHRSTWKNELAVRYEQGKTRYHLYNLYPEIFSLPKMSLGLVFGVPISLILILLSFLVSIYLIFIPLLCAGLFLFSIHDFYWFKPYNLTVWRILYLVLSNLSDGSGILVEAMFGGRWKS